MECSSFINILKFFVYLSYNDALRLTFGKSIQYLLYCSSFDLHYDKIRHEQRFEYIPFISRPSCIFDNFRIPLGPKPDKFKNIESRQKIRYSYEERCVLN